MESSSLLRAEADTPPASAGRSSRVAGVVVVFCFTLGVIGGMSRRTTTAASPEPELYSKKELYGPDYGTLLGDDKIQKAWPGLTCDRSDDDKWGWAEDAMAQPLDSGTNCVYGDTQFCMKHTIKNDMSLDYPGGLKYHGIMRDVSELMWNRCNASCNATDERHVSTGGVNAKLVGKSSLAACQFQGITEMVEVCTGVPEKFKIKMRRRYLAVKETPPEKRRLMNNNPPSVPHRNMTNILINQTYNQDPCNTHALCGMCVDSDGVLDTYCAAFLYYYDITSQHSYTASLFWYSIARKFCRRSYDSYDCVVQLRSTLVGWGRLILVYMTVSSRHHLHTTHPPASRYNVHFWCMDEVLDSISNGTFIDKVESGEIPNNSEIETAWNNHEAIEKFGTWHVPTDDDYGFDYLDDDSS